MLAGKARVHRRRPSGRRQKGFGTWYSGHMKVTIYTDGGSRGNPGPAGAGAIIFDEKGEELARVVEYLGEQTNNYAEYSAVLLGLKKLKSILGKEKVKEARITLKMDSELVARQLRGEYQIKEDSLFPLYIAVHNMRVAHFPNLNVVHVPREENSIADGLSNDAMDSGTGTLV